MKDKPRILAVDDEPRNVKLLEAKLMPQGYEVVPAANGKDALKIIADNDIDLVLLDIMMPEMDGFEVARRLRSNENTQLMPIILITALKETSDRIKGIEAGCDDFISKPFDENELLARVRSLLKIKSLQDELKDKYKKLEELEKTKDSLTHMIVHDLNNPLAVIFLELQLLERKFEVEFSEEQRPDLSILLALTQELKRMISNLLDINKMEESEIKLKFEDFSLGELAKEIVNQMSSLARDEDKILSVEVCEGIPDISADKDLIKRVIVNLVKNGMKFTPSKGSVLVEMKFDESDKTFCVQVSDEGRGIPKEYIERIFEKFIQVETKDVKTGRGLGLTFCKLAIEAHGGKIWAESDPGNGSKFIFKLPYKNKE